MRVGRRCDEVVSAHAIVGRGLRNGVLREALNRHAINRHWSGPVACGRSMTDALRRRAHNRCGFWVAPSVTAIERGDMLRDLILATRAWASFG